MNRKQAKSRMMDVKWLGGEWLKKSLSITDLRLILSQNVNIHFGDDVWGAIKSRSVLRQNIHRCSPLR